MQRCSHPLAVAMVAILAQLIVTTQAQGNQEPPPFPPPPGMFEGDVALNGEIIQQDCSRVYQLEYYCSFYQSCYWDAEKGACLNIPDFIFPTRSPTPQPTKIISPGGECVAETSEECSMYMDCIWVRRRGCVPGPPTFRPTTSPTRSPTVAPTRKPSNSPTWSPTRQPTNHPTKFPTLSPTVRPTNLPTERPTLRPTTAFPTKLPTNSPTPRPTGSPTERPTKFPTRAPTERPTKSPTVSPTFFPTGVPTTFPTLSPSTSPTTPIPTKNPTVSPTGVPSATPTQNPSHSPTREPTRNPTTQAPSLSPTTEAPSRSPTHQPTQHPTKSPTQQPTHSPTNSPTNAPSTQPTASPTLSPTTKAPSQSPTTKAPTGTPTTRAPTSSPTGAPTVQGPIVSLTNAYELLQGNGNATFHIVFGLTAPADASHATNVLLNALQSDEYMGDSAKRQVRTRMITQTAIQISNVTSFTGNERIRLTNLLMERYCNSTSAASTLDYCNIMDSSPTAARRSLTTTVAHPIALIHVVAERSFNAYFRQTAALISSEQAANEASLLKPKMSHASIEVHETSFSSSQNDAKSNVLQALQRLQGTLAGQIGSDILWNEVEGMQVNPCHFESCSGRGTCRRTEQGQPACDCEEGFGGATCELTFTKTNDDDPAGRTGKIIGGVSGSLVFLMGSVLALKYYRKRRWKQQNRGVVGPDKTGQLTVQTRGFGGSKSKVAVQPEGMSFPQAIKTDQQDQTMPQEAISPSQSPSSAADREAVLGQFSPKRHRASAPVVSPVPPRLPQLSEIYHGASPTSPGVMLASPPPTNGPQAPPRPVLPSPYLSPPNSAGFEQQFAFGIGSPQMSPFHQQHQRMIQAQLVRQSQMYNTPMYSPGSQQEELEVMSVGSGGAPQSSPHSLSAHSRSQSRTSQDKHPQARMAHPNELRTPKSTDGEGAHALTVDTMQFQYPRPVSPTTPPVDDLEEIQDAKAQKKARKAAKKAKKAKKKEARSHEARTPESPWSGGSIEELDTTTPMARLIQKTPAMPTTPNDDKPKKHKKHKKRANKAKTNRVIPGGSDYDEKQIQIIELQGGTDGTRTRGQLSGVRTAFGEQPNRAVAPASPQSIVQPVLDFDHKNELMVSIPRLHSPHTPKEAKTPDVHSPKTPKTPHTPDSAVSKNGGKKKKSKKKKKKTAQGE